MYNTKAIIKNAFRITKTRGETAIRIRIPGGHLDARHLTTIRELAERFGNGTVHLTTRQGYEIPGAKLKDLDSIKEYMREMVYEIEKDSGVVLENPEKGYPSAGTRNVSACIGNRVCQFANADTTLLARKIEEVIYPNNYHLKVAVTGCPNDCIKAHMNDIGIIANVIPEYEEKNCILCEACVDRCREAVSNALRIENCSVIRDEKHCIKCGECILKCPTGASYRGKQLYRIIVGGRTGKTNPRLANTFIEDGSEEVVLGVCKNIYSFIDRNIDRRLPKENAGYIIDRAGYDVFAREVIEGIKFNPEARLLRLNNPGYFYPAKNNKNVKYI